MDQASTDPAASVSSEPTDGASDSPEPRSTDPAGLADSLFYSVSHDLRSPLLTMSLSADLITDALEPLPEASGGSVAIALDALRHGARDMERMLQALTLLSRARRRALQASQAPLAVVLGGYVVISDEPDLRGLKVAVDPMPVRDILDALSGDQPAEVHVRTEPAAVVLTCAGLTRADEDADSPLEALVQSLHHHAGTPMEAVGVAQVLLERQGAAAHFEGDGLEIRLPRAGVPAS